MSENPEEKEEAGQQDSRAEDDGDLFGDFTISEEPIKDQNDLDYYSGYTGVLGRSLAPTPAEATPRTHVPDPTLEPVDDAPDPTLQPTEDIPEMAFEVVDDIPETAPESIAQAPDPTLEVVDDTPPVQVQTAPSTAPPAPDPALEPVDAVPVPTPAAAPAPAPPAAPQPPTPPAAPDPTLEPMDDVPAPAAAMQAPAPPPPRPEPPAEPLQPLPNRIAPSHIDQWLKENNTTILLQAYPQIEHTSVRNKAIEKLALYCARRPIDPLLKLAAVEVDDRTHKRILDHITRVGKENVSSEFDLTLLPLVQRRGLLVAIGELGIQKLIPQVRACIDDADPAVQALALGAFSRYGKAVAEHTGLVAERLKASSSPRVQLIAARALAGIGTPEARAAFEDAIVGLEVSDEVVAQLNILQKKAPIKRKHSAKQFEKAAGADEPSFLDKVYGAFSFKQAIFVLVLLVVFGCMSVYAYRTIDRFVSPYKYMDDIDMPDPARMAREGHNKQIDKGKHKGMDKTIYERKKR